MEPRVDIEYIQNIMNWQRENKYNNRTKWLYQMSEIDQP